MQTHDFNPGISPQGVYWTVAVPPEGVQINFGAGTASWQLDNFANQDYFNLQNALVRQAGIGENGPPPVPATASFMLSWSGVTQRLQRRDAAQGFEGEYVLNTSQLQWSGEAPAASGEPSFSFRSTSSRNGFSMLGRERNGSFFQ